MFPNKYGHLNEYDSTWTFIFLKQITVIVIEYTLILFMLYGY